MTLSFLFWFLWLLAFLFSCWRCYSRDSFLGGTGLLVSLMLLVLGIKVFGWPIKS